MGSEPGTGDAARVPIWTRVLVVGVFIASLALRVPRMSDSLWYDEYCRTRGVLNPGRLWGLLLHDVHNPLYNAVMFGWISVFGDSEWSVRLPSLLAGYASLVLFCSIVLRRVGRWAALGVGAWAALAPMHVWYSTEAKNNMFVLAMSTLALWCVDRLNECPTRGRAAATGLSLLALFYTDLAGVLVIVPLLAWPFGVAHGRRDGALRQRAWEIVVAVLVGVLPWAVFKALHVSDLWRGYLEPFRAREMAELLGGTFMTGHAFAPLSPDRTWMAIGVLVVITPLLILGARELWRGRCTRIIVVLMMIGVSGMAVASAAVDALMEGREYFIYQPRNLLCIFYAFGAILWTGVARVRPGLLRASIAAVMVGTAIGGSVLMQSTNRGRFTVDKPRSDWRAVAAAIDADAGGGPAVVVSRSPVVQLERYSARITVQTAWGAGVGVGELRAARGASAAVYYVDDLDWWPITPADVEQWRHEFGVREIARVDRVVVYSLGGE